MGLIDFFAGLGLIEDLVIDVCKKFRASWMVMDALNHKCPNLRSLKLGHFLTLCRAIGSQLDGLALCNRLTSLSLKNSPDLTDFRLIAIGRGCSVLKKLEIHGCNHVTTSGFRTVSCLLSKTLVDVSISDCRNLTAEVSLQAVDPIRHQIKRLHIDCVWEVIQQQDLLDLSEEEMERLEFLSLWIPVGEKIIHLTQAGLVECPKLTEIHIKVEGDCRQRPIPPMLSFGLGPLNRFPNMVKMKLDLGETIGYALTAPSGYMDLSLWERFYLHGIAELGNQLRELDYWPPQDRDVNQRSLSLPAAGLLAQCGSLRKLFIHGTAHEHFMNFLLRIGNLRDVQLREDFYPAHADDMSTEMRVDSCCRFEENLNQRAIPD
ncbi:uncharacterized protein [Phyllobates terribilis]|uniref:uncharacterized protein n=1 Tax=Phyllobates terribilis TaxID=111132 RepID=UPI003CCB5FEE